MVPFQQSASPGLWFGSFSGGCLMFRVRTTAFTLTGRAEVAMPDGTHASVTPTGLVPTNAGTDAA